MFWPTEITIMCQLNDIQIIDIQPNDSIKAMLQQIGMITFIASTPKEPRQVQDHVKFLLWHFAWVQICLVSFWVHNLRLSVINWRVKKSREHLRPSSTFMSTFTNGKPLSHICSQRQRQVCIRANLLTTLKHTSVSGEIINCACKWQGKCRSIYLRWN